MQVRHRGVPLQTHEHIVKEGPRYAGPRLILREDQPGLDTADWLGTKEGLEALTKFLKSSGAFTKTGEPKAKPPKPSLDDDEPHDGGAGAEDQERGEGSSEELMEGTDEGGEDGVEGAEEGERPSSKL
jgi:hypothetical protein